MNNNNTIKHIIFLLFIFLTLQNVNAQDDSTLLKVYFPEGKYTLSPSARNQLKTFANQSKNQQHINIVGRGNQHGSDILNDNLSIKRALAVKSFLISNQFPRENIHAIIGYGRRNPVEKNSRFVDSLNRVVWITVSDEKTPSSGGNKVLIYRDSLVLVSAPYPAKFLSQYSVPKAGDTLLIETYDQQFGDTLRNTRIIYLAIGNATPSNSGITTVSIHDSLIILLQPYPQAYLVLNPRPSKGDTLHIDTTMLQVNTTLYVTRNFYIADDTIRGSGVKEIPEKTKASAIAQAFLDTLNISLPGQAIIIRSLSFEFGYHVMPKSDLPVLEAVSSALKSMPRLKLEIRGHVCCGDLGKDVYDKQSGQYDLSINRAKEVYEYLLTEGVDKSRITFKGYGMKEPMVYPEKGKKDQYKNRRIEFVIMDK